MKRRPVDTTEVAVLPKLATWHHLASQLLGFGCEVYGGYALGFGLLHTKGWGPGASTIYSFQGLPATYAGPDPLFS